MRALKLLLVGAVAAGGALATAAPASAYCDSLIYELTGSCGNPCTVTASAYYTADRVARDRLPDMQFICYA